MLFGVRQRFNEAYVIYVLSPVINRFRNDLSLLTFC